MLSSKSCENHVICGRTLCPDVPSAGDGVEGGNGGLLPTHAHVASALKWETTVVVVTSLNAQSLAAIFAIVGSGKIGYGQHNSVDPERV